MPDPQAPPVILVLPVSPAEWGRLDLWDRRGLRGLKVRRVRREILARLAQPEP